MPSTAMRSPTPTFVSKTPGDSAAGTSGRYASGSRWRDRRSRFVSESNQVGLRIQTVNGVPPRVWATNDPPSGALDRTWPTRGSWTVIPLTDAIVHSFVTPTGPRGEVGLTCAGSAGAFEDEDAVGGDNAREQRTVGGDHGALVSDVVATE